MTDSRHVIRVAALGLVFLLMLASCGDDDASVTTTTSAPTTTTTTAAPTTTTTVAPTTTAAPELPTLVWTADEECVYSGPDSFPQGTIVRFTYRNEASLVVRLLLSPGPGELKSGREVEPDSETTVSVLFTEAGNLAILCLPGAIPFARASDYVRGGHFTVEEE